MCLLSFFHKTISKLFHSTSPANTDVSLAKRPWRWTAKRGGCICKLVKDRPMHIIVFVKLNLHKGGVGGGGLSTAIVRYERRNHFSLFGVPKHAFLLLLDRRSFLRHVTNLCMFQLLNPRTPMKRSIVIN